MTKTKKILWYGLYIVLAPLFLIVALEFVVRLLYPQINFQGNQRSMFVENRFGETMGLMPNSQGEFFGTNISTDEYGFRQMTTPAQYDKSWLLLGDSVTFGPAVEKDMVFAQLIQNEFPNTRVWNSAVIGYSALDYLNVVNSFIKDHDDIEKIILFFCLNDVYGNLALHPVLSKKEMLLSFLKSNSKLYLFLKKVIFDRSKKYALYDIAYYKDLNPSMEKYLSAIVSIKTISDKLGIEFIVVILPYEYQLRVKDLKAPQNLLKKYFKDNNVASIDLYEDFVSANSEDFFLYGDPMHLSSLGHKIVANKVIEQFK